MISFGIDRVCSIWLVDEGSREMSGDAVCTILQIADSTGIIKIDAKWLNKQPCYTISFIIYTPFKIKIRKAISTYENFVGFIGNMSHGNGETEQCRKSRVGIGSIYTVGQDSQDRGSLIWVQTESIQFSCKIFLPLRLRDSDI